VLARRLELEVASFSLVDCCAHFGISHQRRHRADEDVEATVQLLCQLLPLAAACGWDSVDALVDALAPTGGELVYTFEINLDDVLKSWLLEKARWVSRAVSHCYVGQARFPARSPGRPSVSGITRSGEYS